MKKNQTIQLKKQSYHLLKTLATGAQGTVWKVLGDDNEHYALKVVNLYDSFNSSPPRRHRPSEIDVLIKYAIAEIDFLTSLDEQTANKHIAPCLDNGTVKEESYDLPAFIMPLFQKGNLETRIKHYRDNDKLVEKELWLRWFKQLMEALQYIQSSATEGRLATHRDLKPANCLFDDNDNLFLADFGLVRESINKSISSISNVGTPYFLAPEQAFPHSFDSTGRPHFYITDKLDIYSVAIIMHEIIVGSTDAQKNLDEASINKHRPMLSQLKNEDTKNNYIGKLGLTPTDFNNLKQTLADLFNPTKKRRKTIAFGHPPSLPNYQQIANTTALLMKDMLAPWPDNRPDANHVLNRLKAIESELSPELNQLSFSANHFDVFIGQPLSIDFEVQGKGLTEAKNWLLISLDHTPLENPSITPIKDEHYKLEFPIFSEIRQHQLRFSALVNGKEHCIEASIHVKADANYLWTMTRRFDALKLDLQWKWLDEWEEEANKTNSVFAKTELLEALEQLQHHHPDQKDKLQQRFKRNDQLTADSGSKIKKVTALVAIAIATTLTISWLVKPEHSFIIEPNMLPIPAGSFTMGCIETRDNVEGNCHDNEKPAHKVTLKAFQLAKTEVTFAQWDACVKAKGCSYQPKDEGWGRDERPVISVSWDDTQHYIKWLNKETGKHYRLPTEAEWEYAARGGETEQAYPWGNRASHNQANYGKDKCCHPLKLGKDKWNYTAPVASFSANGYGLYDMYGNVWEWVQDKYQGNYNKAPKDGSAWESTGTYRVLRGGAWYDTPRSLRSSNRDGYTPANHFNSYGFGFRLARSQQTTQ